MLVLHSFMQLEISLHTISHITGYLWYVKKRNTMLKLRNTILISMMLLVYGCNSQTYFPLFPCHSVHKIQADRHNSVHYYHFRGNLFMLKDDSGMDCVFIIEGPSGSNLQLDISDAVFQRPGYVSTSLNDNCSLGFIQIYNLTANGVLVQAQKVCRSFKTGPPIVSDTNIAVVTTTASAQGQFHLRVTVLQQNMNSVFRSDIIQDMDKTDVIILGCKDKIFTEDSDKLTQKQAPKLSVQYLGNNINSLTISAIKTKASNTTNNKHKNQMSEAMDKDEEASEDPQKDLINYAEYDYEYEPDEQMHTIQEKLSESEEKLALEKMFDLRKNSKYAKPNQNIH